MSIGFQFSQSFGMYNDPLRELLEIQQTKKQLKKLNKDLLAREKELKEKLVDFVKEYGTIETPEGRLVYRQEFVKRTLQRDFTLDYIRHKYGQDMANDIDKNCTVVNSSNGVWFYRKTMEEEEGV